MFEIAYMWADKQVPNGYHHVDSVAHAEDLLSRSGWVHMWGFSWARGDLSDLEFCDKALIADRRPYSGRLVNVRYRE